MATVEERATELYNSLDLDEWIPWMEENTGRKRPKSSLKDMTEDELMYWEEKVAKFLAQKGEDVNGY